MAIHSLYISGCLAIRSGILTKTSTAFSLQNHYCSLLSSYDDHQIRQKRNLITGFHRDIFTIQQNLPPYFTCKINLIHSLSSFSLFNVWVKNWLMWRKINFILHLVQRKNSVDHLLALWCIQSLTPPPHQTRLLWYVYTDEICLYRIPLQKLEYTA